jgi:arginase
VNVQILGVPYDTGHRGWRCGAGPEHLLRAGLVTHLERRGHHVTDVQLIEDDPDGAPAEIRTAFELMRRIAVAVRSARAAGRFPLILSGNCNAAVGVLSGLSPANRAVLWFDAHGESNTPETTTTGFLDGMGLSTALGWCWRPLAGTVPGFQPVAPEAAFLLGVRDLDGEEAALLAESGVHRLPAGTVAEQLPGLLAAPVFEDALGYVHLDLDGLDPDAVGRANTHPVPGGLSVAEVVAAIGAIRVRMPLGAFTIASYDPEFDGDQAVCRAALAALDAVLG